MTWRSRTPTPVGHGVRPGAQVLRLFVVEYKGGDRITAEQEEEKRMVGELWARRSGGRGIYLMASKANGNLRGQLLAALSTRS